MTPRRGHWILTLLGMLCAGLGGRWWGEQDLRQLLDMPQGSLYLAVRHQAVFQKLQPQGVTWLRIPRPDQARLVRLFGSSGVGASSTTVPSSTATTTTVPPAAAGRIPK